mmetsp:Transcript_28273/g.72124  ORF Transcript_28273/g.72124 Transcript_28273/m.72124 type:complete len:627 (-) Transcript_28273:334-2214(-)
MGSFLPADFASLQHRYKKGDMVAGHTLGWLYKLGQYVKKDEDKSSSIFVDLALRGHWGSKGYCHRFGLGSFAKSVKSGVECYRKGVEEGDAVSINSLGYCYNFGVGVDVDTRKGLSLYRQAAEKGYVLAIRNLGVCYAKGIGVDVDKPVAVKYYKQAADLGNLTAVADLEDMGISYTPSTPAQEKLNESEDKRLELVSTSHYPASSLFQSCISDAAMLKMEDQLLSYSSLSPHIQRNSRQLADALLQSLPSGDVTTPTSTDTAAAEQSAENQELEAAICRLLTVAAGMTSALTDVHDRVQFAIDALAEQLPVLKKISKQRQIVVAALSAMRTAEKEERGEGGDMRVEGERVAASQSGNSEPSPQSRASVLSRLVQSDCVDSLSSVRILRKMRESVRESIEKMKDDMRKAEEVVQKEYQHERKQEFDTKSYLIGLGRQSAEKSKAALPHLLFMSNHLGVDFLHLSGSVLSVVFDMNEMPSLKSEYNSALEMLRRCKSYIEMREKGEEARAVRCPSGLASLLSGRIPTGFEDSPSNETLFDIASHFGRLPSSNGCSEWHESLVKTWSWLECKYSEWSELESRSDHTLADADGLDELGKMMNELKMSGMDVSKRLAQFLERMSELTLAE